MTKHGPIHTRFNAHSKGTLSPIHKGYMGFKRFYAAPSSKVVLLLWHEQVIPLMLW